MTRSVTYDCRPSVPCAGYRCRFECHYSSPNFHDATMSTFPILAGTNLPRRRNQPMQELVCVVPRSWKMKFHSPRCHRSCYRSSKVQSRISYSRWARRSRRSEQFQGYQSGPGAWPLYRISRTQLGIQSHSRVLGLGCRSSVHNVRPKSNSGRSNPVEYQ